MSQKDTISSTPPEILPFTQCYKETTFHSHPFNLFSTRTKCFNLISTSTFFAAKKIVHLHFSFLFWFCRTLFGYIVFMEYPFIFLAYQFRKIELTFILEDCKIIFRGYLIFFQGYQFTSMRFPIWKIIKHLQTSYCRFFLNLLALIFHIAVHQFF